VGKKSHRVLRIFWFPILILSWIRQIPPPDIKKEGDYFYSFFFQVFTTEYRLAWRVTQWSCHRWLCTLRLPGLNWALHSYGLDEQTRCFTVKHWIQHLFDVHARCDFHWRQQEIHFRRSPSTHSNDESWPTTLDSTHQMWHHSR